MPAVLKRVEAVPSIGYAKKAHRHDARLGRIPDAVWRNSPADKSLICISLRRLRKASLYSYGVSASKRSSRATEISLIAERHNYHFGVLNSAMHMAWVRSRLRTIEKRLPLLCRDCLQQFPVAAGRDCKTAAGHRGSGASRVGCPREISGLIPCRSLRPSDDAARIWSRRTTSLMPPLTRLTRKRNFPATATAWRSCSSFISRF